MPSLSKRISNGVRRLSSAAPTRRRESSSWPEDGAADKAQLPVNTVRDAPSLDLEVADLDEMWADVQARADKEAARLAAEDAALAAEEVQSTAEAVELAVGADVDAAG